MRTTCLKRLAAFTAAAMLLVCTGCSGGSASKGDASLQKVLDAKQLVLGLDVNFPPMGYTNESGEIVGFDIDVAQEVCKRLGISLVTYPIDWDRKEEELNSGTIDCIWNGLSISPEREQTMCLSKPYLRNSLVFVVRSDSSIRNTQDLKGKTVGVQAGSTTMDAIESFELRQDLSVSVYDDNLELMQNLKEGNIEAALDDSVNAYYYISMSEERFFVLPENISEEDFVVGFRKDDMILRDTVQNTISEMKADGTLKQISVKWFGSDITIVK